MPSPIAQTPKVSADYIAWLLSTNRAIMGHLYKFTSVGTVPKTERLIWFRRNNGNWNGNAAADPATKIGGYDYSSIAGRMIAYVGQGTGFFGNFPFTANFGATSFAFPVPTGFNAAGAGATWNPADAGTEVTLSGGNLTMHIGSEVQGAVRANAFVSEDKNYFEGKISAAGSPQNQIFGISNFAALLNPYFGGGIANVAGVELDGTININGNLYTTTIGYGAANDVHCVAVVADYVPNAEVSDYFTDLDTDITYGGVLYKSNSLRFEGLRRKVGIGLNVDEQSIKIWATPTDTLFGSNFLAGAEQGLLDDAIITRYRAVWPFITGNAAVDITYPPIAVWPLFTGYTSAITKGGTSHVELRVKSSLSKLNVNMPRNYYQPGCLHTLYDSGCGLIKQAFAVNGTVDVGPSPMTLPVAGGIVSPNGADGIGTYAQGRLQFTSGVNTGLQVLIDSNNDVNFGLAYPLTNLPNAGDGITYYPGCSKTYNTCKLKFNNQLNFRGFDKVPPIMVSV